MNRDSANLVLTANPSHIGLLLAAAVRAKGRLITQLPDPKEARNRIIRGVSSWCSRNGVWMAWNWNLRDGQCAAGRCYKIVESAGDQSTLLHSFDCELNRLIKLEIPL